MSDIGIYLNCASKNEHVPNIEWFNWAIKKRVWYTQADITFKTIYKSMITDLVATAVFWLNNFVTTLPL